MVYIHTPASSTAEEAVQQYDRLCCDRGSALINDIPYGPHLESSVKNNLEKSSTIYRGYSYNCFGEINIGNLVYVAGEKAGSRGMVVAIPGDETFEGYQNVIKIVKIKE